VDEDMLRQTIFDLGLTYDQIRDEDLALTELYQVTGTPTVIVIDKNGQVVWNDHEAPTSWNEYL
jgi:protein-disulfide isomerase